MSVTKARVPQMSSEIFNGSGLRDLQQDRSNILRDGWGEVQKLGDPPSSKFLWCYGPLQYHFRTKASWKFYLYETIYSRRCQSRTMYFISKVYEKGYNSFLLQGIKFSTSEGIIETYSFSFCRNLKKGSQTLGLNLISYKHCF